jgi:hypothetical protein
MTMKYLAGLGLAVAIGVSAAGTASATPIELTVTSGTGSTSLILQNMGSGQVYYSNSDFNGWNLSFAIGTSSSPATALGGLSLSAKTADCLAASCSALTIAVSDIGFTTPLPGGLATGLTDNMPAGPGSAITQWAYVDTSNAYFGSTDSSAMSDFGGAYDPSTASLIGKLALDGGGYTSTSWDGSLSGTYSLTLVDQFCSDPLGSGGSCTGGQSFLSTGSVTAPEPGGLALFGAGLLGVALVVSRRRSPKVRA